MKIQSVLVNNLGIKAPETNGGQKRSDTVANGNIKDSVSLSGILTGDLVEKIENIDVKPRLEAVNSVVDKISGGYYQNPEVLNSVANSVVDSQAIINGTIEDTNVEDTENSGEQSSTIEITGGKVGSGFYDTQEIMTSIAETLIDSLNLSSIVK